MPGTPRRATPTERDGVGLPVRAPGGEGILGRRVAVGQRFAISADALTQTLLRLLNALLQSELTRGLRVCGGRAPRVPRLLARSSLTGSTTLLDSSLRCQEP